VALLVGELEQRALLQLVEGRVGGGGRDVVGGRQLGIVVVRELIDRVLEVARADVLVVERVLGNRGPLGQVPLALARKALTRMTDFFSRAFSATC